MYIWRRIFKFNGKVYEYVKRNLIMKREKSCGAIVFMNDDGLKFLVIQHNKDHGNHWDLPKGHVEEGETEQQTAIREVFEETGIKISIIEGFREQIRYKMHNGIVKDVIYFLANPINKDIHFDHKELQNCKWLSYDEAMKIFTFDNARILMDKAKEFISN